MEFRLFVWAWFEWQKTGVTFRIKQKYSQQFLPTELSRTQMVPSLMLSLFLLNDEWCEWCEWHFLGTWCALCSYGAREREGGTEKIKKVFFYLGEYNTINKSEHLSDTNIRCQFNINCHNSMINTMKADICLVMSESSLWEVAGAAWSLLWYSSSIACRDVL